MPEAPSDAVPAAAARETIDTSSSAVTPAPRRHQPDRVVGLALSALRHRDDPPPHHYAVASPFILVRHGWIWQTIQITWVDRVQVLAISSSLFDRRHGMATLIVDTAAGGAMGAKLHVPYLGANTARALQDRLAAEVAATRFQW